MSCLTLKRSLIAAVIGATMSSGYAADRTVNVTGTLQNWKTWNASSKSVAPSNMPYENARDGIDLVQGLVAGAAINASGVFFNMPVTGSITYDDATGVISALVLSQQGTFTGYYDVGQTGSTVEDTLIDDDLIVGSGTSAVTTVHAGALIVSGLSWIYDTTGMHQTAGTAAGCASGNPKCTFTVSGTNANDHSNGTNQSIFDFQGINSGFQTQPQSNAKQTAYGSNYKNWDEIPGVAIASNDLITTGALTLNVSSRVNSGAVGTNAANTAQFVLSVPLPNSCLAGTYYNGSSCVPASAGHKVPADEATSELPCPVGEYQDETGKTSCKTVTAGFYVDVEGAANPTACPVGTTSPDGATSSSQCISTTPPDADGDDVPDSEDNCVETWNPDQLDYDSDGQGNACDATPNIVTTIQSSGAQDGWLLESTETSKKGGKADVSSSTLIIGDTVKNQEYRSILHFNTAALPDNAVITKATLTLKKATGSKGDVKPLGNILVDLKQKNFGTSASLAIADFEATAGKTSVATLKASGSSYTGTLNSTGRANISKTLATQFKVHFTKDDNNDKGDDYLKLSSGNASSSSRPTLVIEYYVP